MPINLFLLIFLFFIIDINSNYSYSLDPDEFLEDPKLELRARDIAVNIRCLVCQNQSIDDSSAQLAKDLRILIRSMLVEGKTNAEIYNFLTSKYGNFILLKPPMDKSTIFLWALPFILALVSIFVIYNHNRKSNKN